MMRIYIYIFMLLVAIAPSLITAFTEPHGRLVGAPTSKLRRQRIREFELNLLKTASMQNQALNLLNLLNLQLHFETQFQDEESLPCVRAGCCEKKNIRVGKTTGHNFPNIPYIGDPFWRIEPWSSPLI